MTLAILEKQENVDLGKDPISIIKDLDLSGPKSRLKALCGWSDEKCNLIEPQYKAFLAVHLENKTKNLVPSKDVDEMWHMHILHTKKYVDFCNNVFGEYFHHYPHSVVEPNTTIRDNQFKQTKNMMMSFLQKHPDFLFNHLEQAICDSGAYCDGGE